MEVEDCRWAVVGGDRGLGLSLELKVKFLVASRSGLGPVSGSDAEVKVSNHRCN